MGTAWPATRPAHSFLKFRAHPPNVLLSGFRFLNGDNPADPLIAREWRNVLPLSARHRVRSEGFSQIRRNAVYRASGDGFLAYPFHSISPGTRALLNGFRFRLQFSTSPFFRRHLLGHSFGLIPAPGSGAASAFPVPPEPRGSLPECSRLLWEQKPLAFGCLKKTGQEKGERRCTYMLSGIASG
jgi:hypothetical protein